MHYSFPLRRRSITDLKKINVTIHGDIISINAHNFPNIESFFRACVFVEVFVTTFGTSTDSEMIGESGVSAEVSSSFFVINFSKVNALYASGCRES